ncbi:MAG: SET domain-containing protein [Deltaproteobacteria bacterium]|nr:SET domain-containing protein [Deltaproteobacteria bacterium]
MVLLFGVSSRTYIDAAVNGGPAKRINHSCQGNCETHLTARGHIFIVARRNIKAGEELTYDYQLELADEDQPQAMVLYPCHCRSLRCRGTMAALPKPSRTSLTKASAKKSQEKSTERYDARIGQ